MDGRDAALRPVSGLGRRILILWGARRAHPAPRRRRASSRQQRAAAAPAPPPPRVCCCCCCCSGLGRPCPPAPWRAAAGNTAAAAAFGCAPLGGTRWLEKATALPMSTSFAGLLRLGRLRRGRALLLTTAEGGCNWNEIRYDPLNECNFVAAPRAADQCRVGAPLPPAAARGDPTPRPQTNPQSRGAVTSVYVRAREPR